MLFIDLRDHYGMTQVLADPDSDVFARVGELRAETVVRVDGEVRMRDADLVNDKLATGEVEVFIRDLDVLGESDELPLPVFGEPEYPEETRLKYRFLDLRRETMHERIMLRSRVIAALRRHMSNRGFTEFQTPILTGFLTGGGTGFPGPLKVAQRQVLRAPRRHRSCSSSSP